ncbi:MAG: MurR/RpiR family transcriptional regulator [Microbacteriaceae bacterium]
MPAAGLAERLDAAYSRLAPQEQRAAEFMRAHLADLAVYNATEVARLSGVSKATVSRLYRRLGFAGAEQLREHVRALRATGEPVPGEAAAAHGAHLEQELTNMRQALAGVDPGPAARTIARAGRVLVIGFRNSYPMALHLRQQLAQARGGVELAPLPGQSLAEELAGLGARDVVCLLGFRRRPEGFARLVAAIGRSPASLVLLVDPSGRRHAGGAEHALECPIETASAFDSYAAPASLIGLLASQVLAETRRAGAERVRAITAGYGALGELEG